MSLRRANALDFGDLNLTPQYQRHSYPTSIMVNIEGRRFVDEGADFRNYTYAKYGHAVLHQPGQVAWQVFDSKVLHLLRDPDAYAAMANAANPYGDGRAAERSLDAMRWHFGYGTKPVEFGAPRPQRVVDITIR